MLQITTTVIRIGSNWCAWTVLVEMLLVTERDIAKKSFLVVAEFLRGLEHLLVRTVQHVTQT